MHRPQALFALALVTACAGPATTPSARDAHEERDRARANDSPVVGALRDTPPEEQRPTARLGRSVIRGVVTSAHESMRRCYETTFARQPLPWPEGRVMTSFIIGADGAVQAAGIGEGTLIDSRPLHECMIGVIRALRFPEPEGGGVVGVNYPWNFGTSAFGPPQLVAATLTPEAPQVLAVLLPQLRAGVESLANCLEPEAVARQAAGQEIRARFQLTPDGTADTVQIVSLPAALQPITPCLAREIAARRYDLGTRATGQVEMTIRFAP